ncbi:MAG: glycosyl transferase, group 1 [Cytophagaceae bacterium]|jgi:glycosyltransferase involved in cell wall biosynthesis|nr:glycosyl transferase, group 1 [Cytophagaceae bacterium]
MHVLIVSSEELYQDNVMPSVFELSQAKALRLKGVNVAILAVNIPYTYMGLLKRIVSALLGIRNRNSKYAFPFLTLLKLFLKRSWNYISRSNYTFSKTVVEGVDVYSTEIIPFTSDYKIEIFISTWEEAAHKLLQFYIAQMGRPDIIHAHSRFLYAGHFAYTIKQQLGIKYVLTEHSTYYTNKTFSSVVVEYIREMILGASQYIIVGESIVPHIKKKTGLIDLKYVIVPNIIDIQFESSPIQRQPYELQNPFCIINVASLNPNKKHDILIKAFARSFKSDKHIKLKLVGEGLEEGLRALCKEEGIEDSVIFTGKIYDKQLLIAELDHAQFFVLSSAVETFGVVVIEALSRGLPVVSTKCGGPESIIDPENGILVDKTEEALSLGLDKMYNEYTRYNRSLIREQAIKKYGNEAISNRLIAIYEAVI